MTANSRKTHNTNPMEKSGYIQVRGSTGLTYRMWTNFFVCCVFTVIGTRKSIAFSLKLQNSKTSVNLLDRKVLCLEGSIGILPTEVTGLSSRQVAKNRCDFLLSQYFCILFTCAQGRNFISLWEGRSPSDVGLSTPMMVRAPPPQQCW